jgi:hypothetical protein
METILYGKVMTLKDTHIDTRNEFQGFQGVHPDQRDSYSDGVPAVQV